MILLESVGHETEEIVHSEKGGKKAKNTRNLDIVDGEYNTDGKEI